MIRHPIPPLYDEHSGILILGSFPSVKSRETAFFYGHPQNRFWKVLSRVLEAPAFDVVRNGLAEQGQCKQGRRSK